jgi:outer membrane protein assembly factor BamB
LLPRNDSPAGVLLQSTKGVVAVEAAAGKMLWEFGPSASSMCSSVVEGGVAYVPDAGMTALSVPAPGREPVSKWNARQINPSTISPLLLKSRLFSVNNAGILTMADAETGDIKWKLRLIGPFRGLPVGAGDCVALVSEKALV